MEKAIKEQTVGQIRERLANVVSIVLADFRGLDVPSVTKMRQDFRAAGCEYRVLKNTLVKIAVQGSTLEPVSTLLAGPTALIWSDESPSAPAKLAVQFAKDEKNFAIKGGFFEGEVLDVAGVDQLSKMPDKPDLQASLLMTFLAGPTDFVRTLSAGPQNFMYLLDARKRALETSS